MEIGVNKGNKGKKGNKKRRTTGEQGKRRNMGTRE